MSLLAEIRETFKTPMSGTCKASRSPSAGSAGTQDRHLKSYASPSAGSAGSMAQSEIAEAADTRTMAQRAASLLKESQQALQLGRLAICGSCSHFVAAADPYALGLCSQYAEEAWAFVPFKCDGWAVRQKASAPALPPHPDGVRAARDDTK